ncbi:MAG: hypothetical protein KDD36_10460 [Flavobacteriales bacterium]|nr:hypothetical protein [Flavobacteriales bacterium]
MKKVAYGLILTFALSAVAVSAGSLMGDNNRIQTSIVDKDKDKDKDKKKKKCNKEKCCKEAKEGQKCCKSKETCHKKAE